MKVMVTGASGFIGSYMSEHFRPGQKPQERWDVTDESLVRKVVGKLDPEVIIHCAAIKDIELCEQKPKEALKVNLLGTYNIAKECKGRKLIFISTDMVFSGTKGMHTVDDAPNPNTVYGYSKMAAEEVVKGLDDYAICRTSAVYGWTRRKSFSMWLYDKLKSGSTIDVYDNIQSSPTYVENLCQMVDDIIKKRLTGTYHTCGPNRMSKFDFALAFAEAFGFDREKIKAAKAKEAQDISLDAAKGGRLFKFDDVSKGLKRMKNVKPLEGGGF
jgi:dTDP-4-dehydrorhamnose reductase